MLDTAIALQVWGSFWFLLNKIGLSRKERAKESARDWWTIRAWTVYLIGLPAWLAIFVVKNDWNVFAVEAIGIIPVIGIIRAAQRKTESKNFDALMRWAVAIGISLSIWHAGGLTRLTQYLEVGSNVGLLVGAYRLKQGRLDGYLWFLLMNGSMGLLMWTQDQPWAALQQVASLGFVLDAYIIKKRKLKVASTT